MTAAARTGGVFHLWWHPHNFGVNQEENLSILEAVLRHYRTLADSYGMQTHCMGDFASSDLSGVRSEDKLSSGERTAPGISSPSGSRS